ncbi:XisI protein [Nostoc sp. FACHB-87]|uniref:XisI protein n=1 Tax=Nostocales TaxID=1161 RepID=UPI001689F7CA|nr:MULTISPECIES: XisI protein [Nostocales]MBD2300480.1 XisI protein [Nostoc sp. FACHB-190]MBD2453718.1 XisI protein [Nostoc sp. FACHB-87]MBD2475326.1 XisI protein [Anabaena sp. FACHB-83]MBD2488889.1 XisI protein [Aulosira sp. FACHB-615]
MAVEQYRQYIEHLLSERQQRAAIQQKLTAEEYEVQTIFDERQDHYQLLYVGWRGNQRDFGCILHLDIKDGKIWIQHDGTEEGIANRLVEMGVPKQDIILAFHEPYIRQFTEFGTT